MTTKKNKKPARRRNNASEPDSRYFLKLVLLVVLSSLWLKFGQPIELFNLPLYALPVGAVIAVLLVINKEKNQTDRKIWYAIIVLIALASFYLPAGIVI